MLLFSIFKFKFQYFQVFQCFLKNHTIACIVDEEFWSGFFALGWNFIISRFDYELWLTYFFKEK